MTDQEITADWYTLLRQASGTAGMYLTDAIREIDTAFDSGYAKAHPQLVAAFMQVAAADFHSTAIGIAAQKVAGALNETGSFLSDTLHDTLHTLHDGLSEIAKEVRDSGGSGL
jgi:hypothetical protein